MPTALVLGAGMVGSVIAADLSNDLAVTIADANVANLDRAKSKCSAAGGNPNALKTLAADLSDPAVIASLAANADIVVGALPSRLGFAALRAVINAGKHYCDISFMVEDFQELDVLARQRGVTAVVDCGVAPGMSHILSSYGASHFTRCDEIEIYVGGLPRERRWPFEYKAGFAPSDVIEEYTRPARIVEHGKVVIRPALSEPELMDFPGVGTLEAFNTDGLRSLTTTLNVPFMKEKTLRYPGHIALMRAMRETGLFSPDAINVRDAQGNMISVRPLDVTSALMFPKWTYEQGEADLTVMQVLARGINAQGQRGEVRWDMLDYLDPKTNFTSMSRTTAFPCAIMARAIVSGKFRANQGQGGVAVPEFIGQTPGMVEFLFAEHAKRGVRYVHSTVQPRP
jgi:lysine 6-dehydrogenase